MDAERKRRKRWWYVNIYELDRVWGGPEEGGWWFDTGNPVDFAQIKVETKGLAHIIADNLRTVYPDKSKRNSVIYSPSGWVEDTDYGVFVERHPAKLWPQYRPRYE